jgi:large subunit ribosomal protein L6
MSRIGRMPIDAQGVEVDIKGNHVKVKGPLGELERSFPDKVAITRKGDQLIVTRHGDGREARSMHGLSRSLLANMVTGVRTGFSKVLEIEGVGYRVELKGENIVLQVGYSHPVEIEPPAGISFEVERGGKAFSVHGIDKELVGEVAAKIRAVRKPEPYKGKGIRYRGERVRRKAGKAGKIA